MTLLIGIVKRHSQDLDQSQTDKTAAKGKPMNRERSNGCEIGQEEERGGCDRGLYYDLMRSVAIGSFFARLGSASARVPNAALSDLVHLLNLESALLKKPR
ncbi:hypothetical protein R1flu_019220 [Riccia fluitans]|uniref:Uncharacterized protein n=1 Tax=Riccia fluitans TaxID=41844 RepID=A0ABD1ZI14_9MARC